MTPNGECQKIVQPRVKILTTRHLREKPKMGLASHRSTKTPDASSVNHASESPRNRPGLRVQQTRKTQRRFTAQRQQECRLFCRLAGLLSFTARRSAVQDHNRVFVDALTVRASLTSSPHVAANARLKPFPHWCHSTSKL